MIEDKTRQLLHVMFLGHLLLGSLYWDLSGRRPKIKAYSWIQSRTEVGMPDSCGPYLGEVVKVNNSSPTLKGRRPSDRYGVLGKSGPSRSSRRSVPHSP